MPYDLNSSEQYTRTVTTPDGLDQVIAMEGWYWNALDWMHAEKGWSDRDFIRLAWQTARQMENDGTMHYPGNLRAEFARAFQLCIFYRAEWFIHEEQGAINAP